MMRFITTAVAIFLLIPTLTLAADTKGERAGLPETREAAQARATEYVIYVTDPGWLRIGPRSEFDAVWMQKNEIGGGTSEEPLDKELVARGYMSHEEAVKDFCDHLSKVQLKFAPPAAGGPARYIMGVFRKKEYKLRLTVGFDEEMASAMALNNTFYKALEYDWIEEWELLGRHNITPRSVFSRRQWLVHALEYSSTKGPVPHDMWMCVDHAPGIGIPTGYSVRLADGWGGTIAYKLDKVEGPFYDSFTMSSVMKRHGVDLVNLWPPVHSNVRMDVQPRVEANMMPEDPKDYGDEAYPLQPRKGDKRLEDWVIYAVEGQWLHVGTRYEYELPLSKRGVIWAGQSDEPAEKKILLPREGSDEIFTSWPQALRVLIGDLTDIAYSYNPLAPPKETITAKFRGLPYHLRLDRGPNPEFTLESRGMHYSVPGTIAVLHRMDRNITPRKTFREQYLVHATGHSTYGGLKKDDLWLMITSIPNEANNTFLVGDGIGGTFTYSYDHMAGPFTDSYALIEALRPLSKRDPPIKSIGLHGSYRGVSVDEIPEGITPVDHGRPLTPPSISIASIWPDYAYPGDELGIFIVAENVETGCRISLGPDIEIKHPTYFGRNDDPQSTAIQWVATVELGTMAETGLRKLTVYNSDGGHGTLADAFEVRDPFEKLCPPLDLVLPGGARNWAFEQMEKEQANKTTPSVFQNPNDPQNLARRMPLLEGIHAAEDARSRYAGKVAEFESFVQDNLDTEASDDEKKILKYLKEHAQLARELRQIETAYFRGISPIYESFTEGEEATLIASLNRRARCLARSTESALDEARSFNFVIHWDTFSLKKLRYDLYRDDLLHILNAQQLINSMRLMRVQRRLGEVRTELVRTQSLDTADGMKKLRPRQRQLRDVYIDMGVQALMVMQAESEASIMEQDSYLAGVYGVHKKTKNLELAEEFKDASAQALIFSLKYVLAGGLSALGATLDGTKRVVNFYSEGYFGTEIFGTISAETTHQLKECRKKSREGIAAWKRMGDLDDDEMGGLAARILSDPALATLDENRIFHESTSGAFDRLEACFETDIIRQMDRELEMAIRHAELTLADMNRAFNSKIGAEASGHFNHLKRLTTNPMDFVRVALQDTELGGDHFSATHAYIKNREAQIQELEGLHRALRMVDFSLGKLNKNLPRKYAWYLAFEEDHPDFLQWSLVRDRLACQRRMDLIEKEIPKHLDDPEKLAELQRMKVRNRARMMIDVSEKQALIFQMQGADKLMVWDYDGALECYYQAAEWNPKVQPLANVEALRKELVWQKTVEAGMEVATHMGNMGIHTALFEFMGQSIGSVLPIRARTPSPTTMEAGAVKSIWTRPLPASGFSDFVWRQFNPFADFVEGALVQREWQTMARATSGLGTIVVIQVVQQDIVRKSILQGYFGLDTAWADFIANALVNTGQAQMKNGRSLMSESATLLVNTAARFKPRVVDNSLWSQRQQARRSVSEYWTFFDCVSKSKAAREKIKAKKLVNADPATIKAATKDHAEARQALDDNGAPLTKEKLQERYDNLFTGELAPTLNTPKQRLITLKAFFKGLGWKERVMKLGLNKNDPLSIKVDNLRRELLAMAQVEFMLKKSNSNDKRTNSDDIVSILYIGSAGDKHSAAYKKVDSDIDFTFLVAKDMPEAARAKLRDDFMSFYQEYTGRIDLDGFDMSVMVDPAPEFFPTGESVPRFLHDIKNPALRNELAKGIKSTIDQLIRNASDGERYLDRGNLFRHNLSVRLGGYLKNAPTRRDGDSLELVNEPMSKYDELYGKVPLEPWMAFDAVIGNLGYVQQHLPKNPRDMKAYQKVLAGKYAIRGPLFAMLVSSPLGRMKLKAMTREKVNEMKWDGAERVLVEVAKQILKTPGGMKELGLPTTPIKVRGKKQLVMMDGPAWIKLFDQWITRKEGLPLHEVFGTLKGDKIPLDLAMVENIGRSEAFFKVAIRKTIMDQATAIKDLQLAAKEARIERDVARQEVIELKMKEIILSQAAVWNRMSRDQQTMVLKQIPPEADWWMAIANAEGMKAAAGQSSPTTTHPSRTLIDAMYLKQWQPTGLLKDDPPEDIRRRIEELQRRANSEQVETFLLNSQAVAVGGG